MAPKTYESLVPSSLAGVMVFSGLQGVGKSTLAYTLEHPKLSAVLDYDCKGEEMAKAYTIDQYHAPNFMTPDMDPTEYDAKKIADWALEKLRGLREGTTTLIIDNATALEAGLSYLVEKEPAKYGLNPQNVAAGRYGGSNPGVTLLWGNITNWLQNRGLKTIIMINHMTQPWANGAPVPNRFHVKGNKVFRYLSIGTFILTPGESSRGGKPPIPAALVVKESTAIRKFKEGDGFTTIRAWPMRFPIADWKEITKYFKSPASFEKPAVGETWTVQEMEAFGEFLSKEQIAWMREAASMGYKEEGGSSGPEDLLAAGRKRLFDEVKDKLGLKTMNDLATLVKSKKLHYALEAHDAIKQKLLEGK